MSSAFLRTISLLFFMMLSVFAAQAQTNNSDKDKNNKQQQETGNNNEDDDCPESATVRLRVTFDKSGKVTKTEIVLSGGCKYFDEQAVEAARKIKFEPAKKNDEKISVVKLVEYKFTKY